MLRGYRRALAAVLRSYSEEKRREDEASGFVVFRVYRPVSFVVTPLFLAAGVSANVATALGIAAAIAMPAAAVLTAPAPVWVAALAFFYHVMDHVDGNIARTTGTITTTGILLEQLHAIPFWPFYVAAVGLMAHASSGSFVGRHGVEIALAVAGLILIKRQIQDVFERMDYTADVEWGHRPVGPARAEQVHNIGYIVEHAYATLGPVVAGALGVLDGFLLVIAAYVTISFLAWLPGLVATARRHHAAR